MRCSQPHGLPPEAEEFLRRNAIRHNECSHCQRHDGYVRKSLGTYGMFDELEYYQYSLCDGRVAKECIQHEIWDSGPMAWLSLRCGDVEFKWPEEAMEE